MPAVTINISRIKEEINEILEALKLDIENIIDQSNSLEEMLNQEEIDALEISVGGFRAAEELIKEYFNFLSESEKEEVEKELETIYSENDHIEELICQIENNYNITF